MSEEADNSLVFECETALNAFLEAKPAVTKPRVKVGVVSKLPILPGAGVVYLSRIPHGFYEDQMRAYFSQFGEITRLRLSRNRRTGASKHYAFIEFRYEAVARIVVETMNNYLLMGRLLQCRMMTEKEVHPDTWKGANRKFRVVPWQQIARDQHNREDIPEATKQRRIQRQTSQLKSVEERCKQLGINWDASDL